MYIIIVILVHCEQRDMACHPGTVVLLPSKIVYTVYNDDFPRVSLHRSQDVDEGVDMLIINCCVGICRSPAS